MSQVRQFTAVNLQAQRITKDGDQRMVGEGCKWRTGSHSKGNPGPHYMVVLFLIFCGSSICFPRWLRQFTFQPRVHRVPFPPRSCEHLLFLVVLMTAVLPGVQRRRIVVLICISLMISDVEHPYLSICLLPGKMSIQVFCPFSNWDSLGFCH